MSTPKKAFVRWIVREVDAPNFLQVEQSDGLGIRSIICRISDHELCPEHGDILSNAHLIAAAPELLAAAQTALDAMTPWRNFEEQEASIALQTAIAKAKGSA